MRRWKETYKAERKLQAKKRTIRMLEKHMIGKAERMEKMSLDEGGEKEVERVVNKIYI
jgi:SOS response regulatory protein OraA/RecX